MQVLCSTAAFSRDSDPASHEAILTYGPQLTVDGFEVAFYRTWYPKQEQIAHVLQSSGLHFPAIHMEKSIGEDFGSSNPAEQEQGVLRFERNCAFAQEIGARLAVLHLWGPPPYADTHLELNLRPLAHCLDIADHYDLVLAIETIPCTYSDPLSNVKRAFERDARSRVALDSKFLALHNQIDAVFAASWLWQAELVRHVHIKDYDGNPFAEGERRYLHPGEGHIDFGRFVRQLRAAGFDGALSLEARAINNEGRVEVSRLQASLQLLARLADVS